MRRASSARPARAAAGADRRPAPATAASISARLPLQCRTRSQPAVTAAEARAPTSPDSAFIEMSSVIRRPWNAMRCRISATIAAEVVAGSGSTASNTICAVMPMGRSASAAKGAKSVAVRSASDAGVKGSAWWLSVRPRPWPGMCFITGRTPPARWAPAKARPLAATCAASVPRQRFIRNGWVSGRAISRQGTQLPSIPAARSSCAMSRPRSQKARGARGPAAWASTSGGGQRRPGGGPPPPTPPPPPPPETGAPHPTASRRSPVRRRNCAGPSTLRANRMKPKGSASRKKAASSAASAVPAQPRMAAPRAGAVIAA